eukprot:CAMPEP_0197239478 /NCGR_PEP_ID=MMETSP1429-20130617/5941_1 /TAXON_ID=49237 /ORGANISM="Chaetoceros  sp., Strain UNC1202" /LENGTH=128 /DNA_ID=CAMNT_0042698901 /DNA_START=10 /DNA_END=396 /DNA_ORIENTATION=+
MSIVSPFEFIPSQFHLACLFLTGIAGFFIVIGFSSASAQGSKKTVRVKDEPETIETKQPQTPELRENESESVASEEKGKKSPKMKKAAPSTPPKTPPKTNGTNSASHYGSVATPGGRRSARLAQSAKK